MFYNNSLKIIVYSYNKINEKICMPNKKVFLDIVLLNAKNRKFGTSKCLCVVPGKRH